MINYPEWYQIPQVKFRMIQYTKDRESMLIKQDDGRAGMTTRMLRIHNVQSIDLWMKQLYVFKFKREYNFYYSLAKYNEGIPFGTLNLAKRDFGKWTQEHWRKMFSYDFLLDIDSGNHSEIDFAYYSAQQVKMLFDRNDVPYHLRFSGRGFHFLIPYECFGFMYEDVSFDPEAENNVYFVFMNIAMRLHNQYSEMIDTGIYDSRRVIKIPYSMALYNGRNYICTSFDSDEDFNSFELKNFTPANQYHKVRSVNVWKEHLFNPKGNVFKLLKELGV